MYLFFIFRLSDNADINGEDTSSSSSEEEKEGDAAPPVNGLSLKPSWSSVPHSKASPSGDIKEDDEEDEGSCLPTIYFSHTVEPKKVRVTNILEHFTDLMLKILYLSPSLLSFMFCFGNVLIILFLLSLFHFKPVFVICLR